MVVGRAGFLAYNSGMSNDLTRLLTDWQFQPDEVLVRVVPGDDGRGKIQLRVDLGILQMEMNGRPDGLRPEGLDSWLDYYEQQQQLHDEVHPDAAPFLLSEEDCIRLWREGIQYYHRYLSFWHLELYELCAATRRGTCGCSLSCGPTPGTSATSSSSINGGRTC